MRLAVTLGRYNPAEGGYADGTTTLVDAQVWVEQAEYLVESLHHVALAALTAAARRTDPWAPPGGEQRRFDFIEHISLDGVIQSSGEDDFPYSDWTVPYRTPAGREAVMAAHGGSFEWSRCGRSPTR